MPRHYFGFWHYHGIILALPWVFIATEAGTGAAACITSGRVRIRRRDPKHVIFVAHRRRLAELPRQPGRRHPEPLAILLDGQRAGVAVQQQPDHVARTEPLLPVPGGASSPYYSARGSRPSRALATRRPCSTRSSCSSSDRGASSRTRAGPKLCCERVLNVKRCTQLVGHKFARLYYFVFLHTCISAWQHGRIVLHYLSCRRK